MFLSIKDLTKRIARDPYVKKVVRYYSTLHSKHMDANYQLESINNNNSNSINVKFIMQNLTQNKDNDYNLLLKNIYDTVTNHPIIVWYFIKDGKIYIVCSNFTSNKNSIPVTNNSGVYDGPCYIEELTSKNVDFWEYFINYESSSWQNIENDLSQLGSNKLIKALFNIVTKHNNVNLNKNNIYYLGLKRHDLYLLNWIKKNPNFDINYIENLLNVFKLK